MNIAKKMSCLLANDGGTSWMFEFAGVKTLKIFGVTSAKNFQDRVTANRLKLKISILKTVNFQLSIISQFYLIS